MDNRLSVLSPEPGISAKAMQNESVIDWLNTPYSQGPTGVGLGPIEPRFLERKTWPLKIPECISQYWKFVQLVINRIRAGESHSAETGKFLDLLGTGDDWQYILPALGMLPELVEPGLVRPRSPNVQMTDLVRHIQNIIDAKEKERLNRIANTPPGQPKPPQDAEAITVEVRDKVAKLLFGEKGEDNATPTMKRLLTSWMEMAYPGEALQQIIDQDAKRGRGLSRDSLGLPSGLRIRRSRSLHSSRGACKTLPRRPRKPTPKALPSQPVPDEYLSSDEPVDPKKKNSHGAYIPGDSDSPPESLLGCEIDQDAVVFAQLVAAHEADFAINQQREIEEARQKGVEAINGEDGCAFEDTTSESETAEGKGIGEKIKTPKPVKSVASLGDSSTGPPTLTAPTLTAPSPLEATVTDKEDRIDLEQVNKWLALGGSTSGYEAGPSA
ncbi:MAG: hypothetical protein Q9166_001007 [cf. Caloplaca sp. 2 TL-2023]